MKKIFLSLFLVVTFSLMSNVYAATSPSSSGSLTHSNPGVKKVIKKPAVKKVVKKPTPSKIVKTAATQTGSTTMTGTSITAGAPLGKEKGPLAVVLYKYVKSDLTPAQITYIDTSIQEIKAGLAYYEQERDPTLTPEKIKLNMKSFLSSAINEMSDRDIFLPFTLDAIKNELNVLIDGLGKKESK